MKICVLDLNCQFVYRLHPASAVFKTQPYAASCRVMSEADWMSGFRIILTKTRKLGMFGTPSSQAKKDMELKGGRTKGETDMSICDNICLHVFYLYVCNFVSCKKLVQANSHS